MAAASRTATRKPSPARKPRPARGTPKAGTKAKSTAKPKAAGKTKRAATKAPVKKTAVKKTAAKKTAAKKAPTKKASAKKAATNKKASVNRRRFDRRDTRIAARLEHAGGSIEGTVTNLSLEGCLFAPRIALKPNSRIKLYLASESKPVAATVKAVSELGVHCLMHVGGATLGRLSTDLDDMALLMLSAGRPHVVTPKAE